MASARRIPEATVARLPLYLRVLTEAAAERTSTISSESLAVRAGVNAAQVRKDLSFLGSYGTHGVGYEVDYLMRQISRQLGLDAERRAAIVGAGNLGHALASYGGFPARGFQVVAAFDSDPAKVGTGLGPAVVSSVYDMAEVIREKRADVAIVTTPAAAAQGVVDDLVAAGVAAILNFAPITVVVPSHVALRQVDLGVELQILSFYQQHLEPAPVERRRGWGLKGVPVSETLYPVSLVVAGRRCVVIGGGQVAARKVRGLVEAGAQVVVISPEVVTDIEAAGAEVVARPYQTGDLAGAWLALVAVDDPDIRRRVFAESQQARVWVNAADDPESCSFTLPAVYRQGPVSVAVSTAGYSPALAGWIRDQIAAQLGPEVGQLAEILSEARSELQAAGRSTEGLDWRRALDSDMLDLIRTGQTARARERLQACLS